LCGICQDSHRDSSIICVVENPLDVIAIEKTGIYKGVYHVLGGLLGSATAKQEENLKIKELLARIKKENIQEVIIATNPTTEGDLTALYLKRKLQSFSIKITRLGRGLSTGGDIEYADEITLSSSISHRQEI